MLGWLGAAGLACVPAGTAAAKTITVGPKHVLRVPSQAATVAMDGDRIQIDPGTYADCAVWQASRLTIEATGPGVLLLGQGCADFGIFVTRGNNITVRGITFANAHSPYFNGAGIRAFGVNLTVENSRFLNNENGILMGGPPHSTLRVTGSVFSGNGSCEGLCAHGIYVGEPIGVLDVERCSFTDTQIGHHVKSRARNTVIVGNEITDGSDGTSSYLIEAPNGGNLLVQDNVLQKGRRSDNPAVAISIGVEGVTNPTEVLIVRDNRFVSDLPEPTVFVRNRSVLPAEIGGNRLDGKVVPLEGPGVVTP